jgi:hypothetical protein
MQVHHAFGARDRLKIEIAHRGVATFRAELPILEDNGQLRHRESLCQLLVAQDESHNAIPRRTMEAGLKPTFRENRFFLSSHVFGQERLPLIPMDSRLYPQFSALAHDASVVRFTKRTKQALCQVKNSIDPPRVHTESLALISCFAQKQQPWVSPNVWCAASREPPMQHPNARPPEAQWRVRMPAAASHPPS